MSRPRISIITICRNAETTIEQAVQSVVSQAIDGLEYIVVDGASTDGTLAVLEQYKNHFAHFVSEPDDGIANAFNKGIKLATGNVVGLLNADDWLEPNALQAVLQAFEQSQADVVHGNLNAWHNGSLQHTAVGNHALLHREMTINHPATFVRRTLYAQHGLFNEQYRCAMDYELMLRFKQAGARFFHLNKPLVNMRSQGMSDANWQLGTREVARAKIEHGLSASQAKRWQLRQQLAIRAGRWLNMVGLASLLKWWRTRFAAVKKH